MYFLLGKASGRLVLSIAFIRSKMRYKGTSSFSVKNVKSIANEIKNMTDVSKKNIKGYRVELTKRLACYFIFPKLIAKCILLYKAFII